MLHLAILGSTRGTDMVAIIEAIKEGQLAATIDIVVSDKSNAYILERARFNGIPAQSIESKGKSRAEFDRELLSLLNGYPIDVIILIGYMRILSSEFVHRYSNRIINVHPSLLPAFAGGMDLNVHQAVLDAHVKETGCTVHLVDEGVDTGKIICQKKCIVDMQDTAETLKQKVQKLEGEALVEALQASDTWLHEMNNSA